MTELMIPWIPTAKYFKVLCRIGINRPDTTSDTDSYPNLMTQGGTVVISASVSKFRYTESDGRSRVVYIPPQDTYMIQASTGELFDADGNFHVYLLDTSSPGVDPQGFSYKATIRPAIGDPITVNIPGNPDLPEFDLANAVPITPSEGSPALVGRVAVLEEQLKDVSVYPVQQVLLSSNLAYTLPDDAPTNQVISVVFTQTTGGHTVTYDGQPVTVDAAAGAQTEVELWPGGEVAYPVTVPLSSTYAARGTTDLLASTAGMQARAENALLPQVTPTADGSGQTVHPSVVYTPEGWNGFRYWMAVTGYKDTNNAYENPHILASNDGATWAPPPGLTNPIYPQPVGGYNSDTELVLVDGTAYCFFRRTVGVATDDIMLTTSTNGVTWTAATAVLRARSVSTSSCRPRWSTTGPPTRGSCGPLRVSPTRTLSPATPPRRRQDRGPGQLPAPGSP